MGIPNAYCKRHDEIEPQDNEEFWVCPKCSSENMKKMSRRLPCGRKPLDVALEKIEEQLKINRAKEAAFLSRR